MADYAKERPMKPRSDPVTIGPMLERCLDQAAGRPGAAAIWRFWGDAVGPHIARHARPVRLRGSTLLVAVSSAPWMQELQLLKPAIRTQLNARLSEPMVGDIQLVLTQGEGDPGPIVPAHEAPRCGRPPEAIELDSLPGELGRSLARVLAAWRRRAGREDASS